MMTFEDLLNPEIIEVKKTTLTDFEIGLAEVVLSFIVRQYSNSFNYDNMEKEIGLNSRVLQEYYSKYPKVLKYLIENGIIKKGDFYIIGKQCTTYWLNDMNYSKGYKIIGGMPYFGWSSIDTFKSNVERFSNAFSKIKKQYVKDLDNAETTERKAINDFNVLKGNVISFSKTKKELKKLCVEKGKSYSHLVKVMDSYNFNKSIQGYTFDKEMNRSFNIFTNTPSILRDCMLFNGNPVSSIDITNSQPQLSVKYLKEMGVVNEKYNKLVKGGKIYEFIMERLNITRDQSKKIFLKYFYGTSYNRLVVAKDQDTITNNMMVQFDNLLHTEFTNIWRFLKSNKENIAVKLQYEESKLMNKIYRELESLGYNESIISLFDAYYIIENDNAEMVKGIIKFIMEEEEVMVKEESKNIYVGKEECISYINTNIKKEDNITIEKNTTIDYNSIFNEFLVKEKEKLLNWEF